MRPTDETPAGAIPAGTIPAGTIPAGTMPGDATPADAIELLGRVRYGRIATSMRAMPFMAPARHVLVDGSVVLRLHRDLGCHRACDGSVVAYGADNLGSGADVLWSVQVTGTAHVIAPSEREVALFGPPPRWTDGAGSGSAYVRVRPAFATVQMLDSPGGSGERPSHHAP
ncbi:pyridoxamine 5'-phosphate oxidase family protein [Streptomyces gobitricini]|uniref:Pyridoxamine 5'-phosphate oxidase family protein n=1 Tax=Streptomyces gobitricini TaxID=68211 RepID=A0ABN3L2Q5_9ACTN